MNNNNNNKEKTHNLNLEVRIHQINPNPGTFCKSSQYSSKPSKSRTTKVRLRSCSRLREREETRQPKLRHDPGLIPGSGKKKKSLKGTIFGQLVKFEYVLCIREWQRVNVKLPEYDHCTVVT